MIGSALTKPPAPNVSSSMEAMVRPSNPAWLEDRTSESTRSAGDESTRWLTIFTAIAGGRLRALDELYDLAATEVYRLALWRTGSREDAEDVVQDVVVKVVEQGDRLAKVRHPRRWLLTVTHRRAIDAVRKRRRRRTEPIEATGFLEAPPDDQDLALEARRLSRLIARLPEKQREVVLLRHFADCTFADIGRITGVPTFTAASRHRLAIAKLRRLLEKSHESTT